MLCNVHFYALRSSIHSDCSRCLGRQSCWPFTHEHTREHAQQRPNSQATPLLIINFHKVSVVVVVPTHTHTFHTTCVTDNPNSLCSKTIFERTQKTGQREEMLVAACATQILNVCAAPPNGRSLTAGSANRRMGGGPQQKEITEEEQKNTTKTMKMKMKNTNADALLSRTRARFSQIRRVLNDKSCTSNPRQTRFTHSDICSLLD